MGWPGRRANSGPSGIPAGSMTSLGTYWRTVRHLKFRQIVGRLVFRAGARLPTEAPAPGLRPRHGEWIPPPRKPVSLVSAGRFRFLNRERLLSETGWDSRDEEKLWRYNLHYFDDLNAEGAAGREADHLTLMRRWIEENRPPLGTGWEPYPTSLRIVNWLKWQLTRGNPEPWLNASLAVQVRWLIRRLEWHLLGNHLFSNAKALFAAGLFFEGAEADAWRSTGAAILARELPEQILGDGGQFERTPMYHLLAFEDVLDLIAFSRCFGTPDGISRDLCARLESYASAMWQWADVMRFRSGRLPRFNDTSDGVAPDYRELERVASALDVSTPETHAPAILLLPDTGYARLDWSDARAFFDVAAVGPEYLPGHAHADTLSLELEIGDRMLIVNRCTSCYGKSARRFYERSTAAHSTVELAGRSSSETWSGFRVGRRARPRDLEVTPDAIACAHDGYHFMPGRPMHRRRVIVLERGVRIEDRVDSSERAVARFHLAPGVRALQAGEQSWRLVVDGKELAHASFEAASVSLVDSQHAAAFGILCPAQTLEIALKDGRASSVWAW